MIVALLVTAVVPLLAAMALTNEIIGRISGTAFQPEFGEQLERSLGVYADLVSNMKRAMRSDAAAIAHNRKLLRGLDAQPADVTAPLAELVAANPHVVSLSLEDANGAPLGAAQRKLPLDEAHERAFTVQHTLAGDPTVGTLTAVFAADRTRLDELEDAQIFTQAYRRLEKVHRGEYLDRPYLSVFAVLLGITVVLAVIMGILVMRPVTRRIKLLAAATQPVAEGDLSVRVDESGHDEIAELAHAFNNMLETMGRSRARIEFLKRVGQWQIMARRLAHEIKNPLTPIQLAVEECHRRYDGDSKGYKRLLQTTLDIVVEEVQSLRHLVGEFAEFARLPRANLVEGDLTDFLREQKPRLLREAANEEEDAIDVDIAVDVDRTPVAIDRTMLYRVLSNLVANARQAAAEAHSDGTGKVRVLTHRDLSNCQLEVEDNGKGVEPAMRATIFDPYVTTKQQGTGLGLTICKKIIIDHGGHIEVDQATLGGARFRITLPLLGTPASEVALARSERHPMSG